MFNTHNPALLIIDVQQAIDEFSIQPRSCPGAEGVISSLLAAWREKGLPVVHVRHASKFEQSPYHRDAPGFAFKAETLPLANEPVIEKRENCAFIGTALEDQLRALDVSELVVCGVLVNNSVDATVRVAAGYGYSVFLPSDATAAFAIEGLEGRFYAAEDVHGLSLSILDGEYARVIDSAALLHTLP